MTESEDFRLKKMILRYYLRQIRREVKMNFNWDRFMRVRNTFIPSILYACSWYDKRIKQFYPANYNFNPECLNDRKRFFLRAN